MQTIRILFYTDVNALEDENDEKCVSDLRRFIDFKLNSIAKVFIQVRVRQVLPGAPMVRLTPDLLKDFDELWVFGFGLDDNLLLEDEEVTTLCEWMKTGGVMVTGDHSQTLAADACRTGVPHNTFRSLGFPLGSRIPRAGQLRVWTGPPTNCPVDPDKLETSDTFNTQVPGSCDSDLEAMCLQRDRNPQRLEDMPSPHFLFTYDYDEHGQPIPITQFPDHMHVGHVLEAPDVFDACWPPRPPFPQVVAKGRDKRPFKTPRTYNLDVAYDGDQAGVGRIVADASFHHFINLNLRGNPPGDTGIPERDAAGNPKPGTALDQIAQFYANLAYWLAPKTLRDDIKRGLLVRVAKHIDVFETYGSGPLKLGRVAKQALISQVGEANLRRILDDGEGAEEKLFEDQYLTYALSGRGVPEGFSLPGHEHLLGHVIEEYYEHLRQRDLSPLRLTDEAIPREVIFGAMEKTFAAQNSLNKELMSRLAQEAKGLINPPEPGGEEDEGGAGQQ